MTVAMAVRPPGGAASLVAHRYDDLTYGVRGPGHLSSDLGGPRGGGGGGKGVRPPDTVSGGRGCQGRAASAVGSAHSVGGSVAAVVSASFAVSERMPIMPRAARAAAIRAATAQTR